MTQQNTLTEIINSKILCRQNLMPKIC